MGPSGLSLLERLKALFERRIDPVDMLILARQLHTLLKAGVPILRALAGLTESAASQQMKNTLLAVRSSLESGIELSRSFAQQPRVFDHFFVAMVRVGEMTGRLTRSSCASSTTWSSSSSCASRSRRRCATRASSSSRW